MSVRLRYTVAIAAAGALAVLSGAGPAAAAPAPSTTTDPAAAAAGWLARQFVQGNHVEGTYQGKSYVDYGGTADAIFGLAAAKVGQTQIAAATAYLGANVAAYTSIGSGDKPGPYDGSVAKLALAAIVAGADPTNLGGHNLLKALKDDECTALSGPVSKTDYTTALCPAVGAARNVASSVSESLAMLAEARGAAQYGPTYAPSSAGVAYFLSLQCANGGFTSGTKACGTGAASVDETAYAAMALAALGGHDTELARANAWLLHTRNSAGYWVVEGGPDVDSTALASAALGAAGQDVTKSRAWLVSQQVTEGPTVGAGATRGALKYQGTFSASLSVKATADGVLGLAQHASLATLTAKGVSSSLPVLALAPAQVQAISVKAGGSQTVSASGFSAGERVSGVLHSTAAQIGSSTASKSGTVTLTFTVPEKLAGGKHTVVLTGATSGLSVSTTSFAVTRTHSDSSTGTVVTVVVVVVVLLVAGAGATYLVRRRRA